MFTEEQKAEIAKMIAAETKTQTEEIERLKAHNEKLIEEKRDIREKNKQLEESEAAKRLAEAEAEIEALKKGGKTEELQAALEKKLADAQAAHDKAVETLTKERDDLKNNANNMIAERDLAAAIAEANIAAPLVPAFTALVKSKGLEVNTHGESPYAMIEGRKVSDYIKDFTATDDGKHFVSAPGNGGGGNTEPGKPGTGESKTFAEMTLKERTELHKSDPAAYKAAVDGQAA